MKRFYAYFAFLMSILILFSFSAAYAQNDIKLRGIELSGNANTPHRVFIVFKSNPGGKEENFVKALGGQVKYTYGIVPAIAASIPEVAIKGLLNNPNVIAIEAVGQVTAIEDIYPWGITQIGSDIVHNSLYNKGYGVKVAIIDTGIDYNHPDLSANYVDGYNFIEGYPDPYDPYDDNSHGTHVAGIVAADDNYSGIIGVAPDAQLIALKVLDNTGTGWDYDIVAALDWIADYNSDPNNGSPIRITNNSYSGSDLNNTTVQQAFDNLASAGVLHVSAAGNTGNWFGWGDNVGYPARFASNIAVAATDSSDSRASFSSTGPDVELSAPGVSIESTVPGDGTALKNGTSMASPHVAGVAALVMASGMTDPDQVRNRLIATADDIGASGKDNLYGWGLVDADEAADLGPVDNPPSVSMTDPNDGATINGSYTVIAEATDDNGVVSVTLSIDGGTPQPMIGPSGNSWVYDWDTTSVTDGNHSLVATATDDAAQTIDSAVISVTVDNLNESPTADFSFTTSGLTVTFTDLSTDSDGTIAGWSWDFGDGNSSTEQNPTHTYAADGTYTVSLTVTDNDGATSSVGQEVVVSSGSQNISPTADFSFSTSDLTATFTDLSTDDGTITEWSWNFGDGATSTEQNPTHTYAASGTYSVTLTVTDDGELSDSLTQQVTVVEPSNDVIFVSSLDGSSTSQRNKWTATVTITASQPVSGAVVTGTWSDGVNGPGECTTDGNGTCSVSYSGIRKNISSVTFTITGIESSSFTYDPALNDVDYIIVSKP